MFAEQLPRLRDLAVHVKAGIRAAGVRAPMVDEQKATTVVRALRIPRPGLFTRDTMELVTEANKASLLADAERRGAIISKRSPGRIALPSAHCRGNR